MNIKENRKNKYNNYLKSEEWKEVKNNYYRKNLKKCLKCKTLAEIHLHHLSYSILEDKRLQDNYLVPLCKSCHSAVHSKKLNPSAIGDPTRSKVILSKAEFIICAVPNFRPIKMLYYFKENTDLKSEKQDKNLKRKIRKTRLERVIVTHSNKTVKTLNKYLSVSFRL